MIQQGSTEVWGVGQVVLPPSAQWNVFLFLRCRVNRLELSLPSHSADPSPIHLHHAPVFLLDRAPPACVHVFAAHIFVLSACGCASVLCVLLYMLTCSTCYTTWAAHIYTWIFCHLKKIVCIDFSYSVVLLLCWGSRPHHPSGFPSSCQSVHTSWLLYSWLLYVVLFHGSLRWFVPYLLPTHCAWGHSVWCNLLPEMFAGYKCVFITVVYPNARAPGVLIRDQLCTCVCAVRLLICTTPNSVYSYSKSVKSQV